MKPVPSASIVVAPFDTLSDDELVAQVQHLAASERRASVALIRSLVEFDTRQLHFREGCSSLFTYCTHILHLSEGSAYNRIETARAAKRYPAVIGALERGDLTLTAVRMLAPHLTVTNHAEVLAAARHRSKLAIQELIASLTPRPEAATIIRRVAAPTSKRDPALICSAAQAPETSLPLHTAHTSAPSSAGRDVAAVAPRQIQTAVVTPLAPERYKLQVTLSRETHEKLRRAQALARHAFADGDVNAILDRALTLLVDNLERRRCARLTESRQKHCETAASGRDIPSAVRRAVWQRDEGRCRFVGREGQCRETSFLEFHHVVPYAAGGSTVAENIELRCRAHNQYEARLFFGPPVVRERPEV